MLYQGGAVRSSVNVYVVFWGTGWQAPSQASVVAYIDGYFTDLGGSPWAGIMGQYCSGASTNSPTCPPGGTFIKNPVGQLKGQINDTRVVPYAPSFQDVSAEVAFVATSLGFPSGALYMVYTPSGVKPVGFETQYCAYHSWVYAGGSMTPFGFMPYQPDAGYSCGASSLDGPLDGFSIVSGHEYAEAVTDPFPTSSPGYMGWIDPTLNGLGEIGDKCVWDLKNVTMNGHTWPAQSLFSNAMLALARPSCVFGVPNSPSTVTAAPGNAQAVVRWIAPQASGGSPVTGFRVTPYIGLVAQAPASAGLATTVIVPGLVNGTPYTFTVAALSFEGTGAESSQSNSVIPATVPGPPTGVVATTSNGQFTVTWIAPVATGGSPIISYTVTCTPACTPVVTSGSTLQAVIISLVVTNRFTFTVTAANLVGSGPPSIASNPIQRRDPVHQSSPVSPPVR